MISEPRDLLGGNGILLSNHVMRHTADILRGHGDHAVLIVGRDITGIGAFR